MVNKVRPLSLVLALILVTVVGVLIVRAGSQAQTTGTYSGNTVKAAQPNAPSGGVGVSAVSQDTSPNGKTLPNGVRIVSDTKHDTSPPLRDIPPAPAQINNEENENANPFPVSKAHPKDPVVQNYFGPIAMPTPILTFEGISATTSGCGCLPPDTNGDVGPNNYVQIVNTAFEIFDKNGTVLQTARPINTIWSGFGGACETHNSGDPVALYDQLADRWVISQFTSSAPYNQCVAVSTTGDPTGSYYRYAFLESNTNLYDYPKMGVWPDAYYMTANVYQNGQSFINPSAIAFDRNRMLQGLSATFQEFNPGNYYFGLLPSDLDGSTPPPAGEPNFFVTVSGNLTLLHLWKFHVDWSNPVNSTFIGPTNVVAAPWDPDLCGLSRNCIHQPGVAASAYLDSLGDHTMNRLVYRNMGDHESLLTDESVDANGADQSGVRWYELRDPNGSPNVFQQGTYAPDADSRWMGSIAMDGNGDIAVGYNVSSDTTYPSIRYAGRLPTDPPGILGQGEATLIAGTGSQTSTSGRWGDYSNMSIDPSDDCTFWFTTEYYTATSSSTWHTRVGKFKFPGCVATTPTPTATGTPPTPTNTAIPTNTPTALPTSCANYAIATGTATMVAGTTEIGPQCDDCALHITLPFAVKLYDQSYTEANLTSNGTLEYVSSDYAFGNAALPVPIFDHAIAGFWDDLCTLTNCYGTPCTGCGVYTVVSGTAPNRIVYYEWRGLSLGNNNLPVDFEIALHENSNNFEVIYGAQTAGNGVTATTGVEKNTQYFTQYSYNQAVITPGLMLSYTKQECAVSTPTDTPVPASPTNTPVPQSTSSASPTNTLVVPTDTPETPTVTPTACTLTFTDVPPNSTFYNFIHCLVCLGIINGYPDHTFKPNASVTRGQLSKIVANSAGFDDTPTGQQFQDVPASGPGSTFYVYIYRLVHRGFINGYPCGGTGEPCVPPANLPYFRPNANATRGQISKIVSNAANFNDPPTGQQFEDVAPGSTYYTYTYRLVVRSVMSGYACGGANEPCVPPDNRPYFRPNNNATRGQTAKIDDGGFFTDCSLNPPSARP